jgi:hypothetical protein
MRPLFIIFPHPLVYIRLQLFQGLIQLLSEEQAVALVLHGLMQPLTDAVGLGMVGLGLGVVNILNGQVELVGVVLWLATVLRPSVGQDAL